MEDCQYIILYIKSGKIKQHKIVLAYTKTYFCHTIEPIVNPKAIL